jgi:pimeloyl-ACP methyl ester carboxylesterase
VTSSAPSRSSPDPRGAAARDPVLAELANRYGVVVADLPGLGESAPVGRRDAPRFVRWFDRLLRATADASPR